MAYANARHTRTPITAEDHFLGESGLIASCFQVVPKQFERLAVNSARLYRPDDFLLPNAKTPIVTTETLTSTRVDHPLPSSFLDSSSGY